MIAIYFGSISEINLLLIQWTVQINIALFKLSINLSFILLHLKQVRSTDLHLLVTSLFLKTFLELALHLRHLLLTVHDLWNIRLLMFQMLNTLNLFQQVPFKLDARKLNKSFSVFIQCEQYIPLVLVDLDKRVILHLKKKVK